MSEVIKWLQGEQCLDAFLHITHQGEVLTRHGDIASNIGVNAANQIVAIRLQAVEDATTPFDASRWTVVRFDKHGVGSANLELLFTSIGDEEPRVVDLIADLLHLNCDGLDSIILDLRTEDEGVEIGPKRVHTIFGWDADVEEDDVLPGELVWSNTAVPLSRGFIELVNAKGEELPDLGEVLTQFAYDWFGKPCAARFRAVVSDGDGDCYFEEDLRWTEGNFDPRAAGTAQLTLSLGNSTTVEVNLDLEFRVDETGRDYLLIGVSGDGIDRGTQLFTAEPPLVEIEAMNRATLTEAEAKEVFASYADVTA